MSRYVISLSASRYLNEISDYFLIRNLEAGESPGEPNLGFIVDIGIRFDF
jgi:hypothetical protein